MTTGLTITPHTIDAVPGEPGRVVVTVANHLQRAAQFQVRVVGSDATWSGPPLVTPLLDPGASTSTELTVTLPLGFPVGQHLLGVEAVPITPQGTPSSDQQDRRVTDLVVMVGSLAELHAVLEPANVWARQGPRFSSLDPRIIFRTRGTGIRRARGGEALIQLRNRGFEPIQVALSAESPAEEVSVRFDRDSAVIPPGHVVPVKAKFRGSRPWWGRERRSPYTIIARSTGSHVHLDGTLTRPARIPPSAMKGLAIVSVLAVWASTLFFVWDRVTTDAQVEQATAEQAGADGTAGGVGDATDPDGNGDGAGGNGNGSFTDEQIGSRVEASGQVQAREPDGVAVRIRSVSLVDEISQDATFRTGNLRSASAGGAKLFGRRGGMVHNRIVPAQISTVTDDEGRWAASGLGGPGFYEVRFSKAGYATRAYVVEMTEDGGPITLDTELVAGDGSLGGRVSGPDGPLGDVQISVTDGTVTLNTSTPTTGAVGTWTVDGLTTPGTYLVTASRRGYGTATQLVRLSGGQSLSNVQLDLQPGTGAITGTVRAGSQLLGDVTITATDGDVTRTTTTLTEGPVGTFSITDLPSPGIYTLSIEADGYLSQTRDVALSGGQTQVGIEMVASTGIIYGRLTDPGGNPIGGAGVTATSEDAVYKNTTAPDGTYEMVGLEPGSYVVEFEEFEYFTGSALVTLGSGALREVNLSLNPRDTLEPAPNNSLTVTLSAPDITENVQARVTIRGTDIPPATANVSSGGAGNAVFNDIPAGIHVLEITGQGFQETTVTARVALNGNNGVGATLRPLVVTNIVLDNFEGDWIADADVSITRTFPVCGPNNITPGCQAPIIGRTNAEGEVRVQAGTDASAPFDQLLQIGDGTYRIEMSHPDYIDRVDFFSVTYDSDPAPRIPFRLNRLAEVRFAILTPQNIEGTGLGQLVALSGYTVSITPTWGEPDDHTRVADGNPFSFTGIPQGTGYEALITRTGFDDLRITIGQLALNERREINRLMFPSRTTQGRVVWDDPDAPGEKLPIDDVTVTITGIPGYEFINGQYVEMAAQTWETTTGPEGQWGFPTDAGPVRGTATVTFDHPDFEGPVTFDADGTLAPGDDLTVTGLPVGQDLGDFELVPLDGRLTVAATLDMGQSGPRASELQREGVHLRFTDGPADYPEDVFTPSGPITITGGGGGTGGSPGRFGQAVWNFADGGYGDLPPGTYRGEITYEHPPDPDSDTFSFTPVEFEVYVGPNADAESIGLLNRRGLIDGEVATYFNDDGPAVLQGPTEGATVTLERWDPAASTWVFEREDTTDADGNFRFARVDTGPDGDPLRYRVSVSKQGYTDGDVVDDVTLLVGGDAGFPLTIRRLASVLGLVEGARFPTGDPEIVEDGLVLVYEGVGLSQDVLDDPANIVAQSTTDENGFFQVFGLEAGNYTVIVRDDPDQDDFEPLTFELGGSGPGNQYLIVGDPLGEGEWRDLVTDFDSAAQPGDPIVLPVKPANLTFKVQSTNGSGGTPQGLGLVLIRVADSEPDSTGNGESHFCNFDGGSPVPIPGAGVVTNVSSSGDTYFTGDISPGFYVLCLNAPNHAPKEVGYNLGPADSVDQTGEDAIQLAAAGNDISGTVTLRVGGVDLDPEDFSLADTLVELLVQDDGDWVPFTDDGTPVTATTNANGEYALEEVPDGTYRIRFSRPGYDGADSQNQTLRNAADVTVNATLEAFQHDVVVTVRSAVGDELLQDARVFLEPDPQVSLNTTDRRYPTSGHLTTDEDGQVTFDDVVPGRYIIVVNDEYQPGGRQRAQQTLDVTIADDPPPAVTVTIQEARVTGNVEIQGSGSPTVTGVRVAAQHTTAGGEEAAFVELSGTGATASFELFVPTETSGSTSFDIVASRSTGNFLSAEDTVTVTSGATVAVSTDPLLIREAAVVRLQIREADTNTSITGATVQLRQDGTTVYTATDGGDGDASASTTPNGTIELAGVVPGSYEVRVTAAGVAQTDLGPFPFSSGLTNRTLNVVARGSLELNLTGLPSGNGTLQARVRNTSVSGSDWQLYSGISFGPQTTPTIPNLQTGTYEIQVCQPSFGDDDLTCEPGSRFGTGNGTVNRDTTTSSGAISLTVVPEPEPDPGNGNGD